MSATTERGIGGSGPLGPVEDYSHKALAVPRRRSRRRLFERNDYLSDLRTLFSVDWAHPVGPIVVEGRAGVGKTALIGATCQMASEAGWVVLRARGDSLKTQVPFLILRRLLDFHEGSGGSAKNERPELITVLGCRHLSRSSRVSQAFSFV